MAQAESINARVRQARSSGDQFGISMTVLAELYYAVYASQRRQENLRRLQALVSALILWPFDELAAEAFGVIQAEQKAIGRPNSSPGCANCCCSPHARFDCAHG